MWTFQHDSACKICAQNEQQRRMCGWPSLKLTSTTVVLLSIACSHIQSMAGLKLTCAHIFQLEPCVLSDTCNANTSTYLEIHTTCTL